LCSIIYCGIGTRCQKHFRQRTKTGARRYVQRRIALAVLNIYIGTVL
jgi:hypothetical protein